MSLRASPPPVGGGSLYAYKWASGDPINDLDEMIYGSRVGSDGCGRSATVVNLPASGVGTILAAANGASCRNDSSRNITVCTGARGGFNRGGTMYGSVFLTGARSVDDRLIPHEAKHANQWAWFGGGPLYPIAYGLDEYVFSKGGSDNHFERQAGLRDGCYGRAC